MLEWPSYYVRVEATHKLRYACSLETGLCQPDRCSKASTSGSDYNGTAYVLSPALYDQIWITHS